MKQFNLTEWTLNHRQLIYFFMAVVFILGIISYNRLGRSEDPDFVIREMVIAASWPGASARQVEEQVTDKIEKKLQDTPGLDVIRSYSKPGQAVIYVELDESVRESQVRPTWLEVRNMVHDMEHNLPDGVVGPYFNDRFDDVYGSIYALTGDGFTLEELRVHAEKIRQVLLGVDAVGKVELVGVQPEKIHVEVENHKLAQLGIDPGTITEALQSHNAMTASGMLETASDNVYVRVSGFFQDVDSIRELSIRANDRSFRLDDIAKVYRGYADPAEPKMFYNGQPAIGLAVSMEKGGNILDLGDRLAKTVDQLRQDLPLGLEVHQVADQPKVVKQSINEFVKVLIEALVIVLGVSFLSLGVRTGIVVALCIPLVITAVFVCMEALGIHLHKISLGALIIALGLLVDDAIIAVEMMSVKLEQGWNKTEAACYAYTATAFPMLTGTLITAAGFMPVGFAKGSASEFVGSIFWVVTIALVISWLVAVTVTPLLGYYLIKVKPGHDGHKDQYDNKFYHGFRRILIWCLEHRWLVIGATAAAFIISIYGFKLVRNEFFPNSTRPELIVEMRLPEGASLTATEAEARRFGEILQENPHILNFVSYVGEGSPRFVLTASPTLDNSNYAQFIILAKDSRARDTLRHQIEDIFKQQFENVRATTKLVAIGPPADYPVMLRVSGYEHDRVRQIADHVRTVMAEHPHIYNINFDWYEKNKAVRLHIDQNKVKLLGLDNKKLAAALQEQLAGTSAAEFREGDKTIAIIFRSGSQDRNHLSNMKDLNIHIGNGRYVPLQQIADIRFEAEEGLVWRRDLKPTITVQGNIAPGLTGNDVTMEVYRKLEQYRSQLPSGYSIELDGAAEMSGKALGWLMEPVPAMVVIMMTLLMLQLQSISRMMMVLLTAPLGIIGVSLALILFQRPLGFVAQLGVLALAGMIIRNSVILIDQIEKHIAQGQTPWEAIIDSAVLRFRPIMLTAAAAILAMIPLASSAFWGPMAVAIGGGLFVATVLTLLVLPAMYAAWFKVAAPAGTGTVPAVKLSE